MADAKRKHLDIAATTKLLVARGLVPGDSPERFDVQVAAKVIALQAKQELVDATLASLSNAVGINRAFELPAQSVIGQPLNEADRSQELLAALSETSPVLTGNLAASWLDGRGTATYDPDTDTYILDNQVAYARINDLGGDTGKGGNTHINPSYYGDAAGARVGVNVAWVPGPLAGAGGVGVRGTDVSAGADALGVTSYREAA